ncbi:MAG: fibrillarin-like rRNA/tRNA 2'-O-methyltransferase [Promethearchaeota archaeon]
MTGNYLDVKPYRDFQGVFTSGMGDSLKFFTKNLVPGEDALSEKLFQSKNGEVRGWNPHRSKMVAAIQKGLKKFPLGVDSTILYLGAANGTTVSHFSDIVTGGKVYAVEFSPRSLRELVQNCQNRYNVYPILADATKPQEYRFFINQPVDIVYQDVAQPNQAEILASNARWYLRDGGYFFLAVKTRSIDTTKQPSLVVKKEVTVLEESGFAVEEITTLEPYSKDHAFILGTKK